MSKIPSRNQKLILRSGCRVYLWLQFVGRGSASQSRCYVLSDISMQTWRGYWLGFGATHTFTVIRQTAATDAMAVACSISPLCPHGALSDRYRLE